MSDSSDSLFDIVFRGDILPGHQLMEVKQRLGQLFKADANKINALFTGGAVPLKRNLEKSVADKYVRALNQAGAEVQVMAAGALADRSSARKARAPAKETSLKQDGPAPSARKMTLAERLAAQEQEAKAREADAATAQALQESQAEGTGLTLAPVGADMLQPQERQVVEPVQIDVSQLDLREPGGNLLDASEQVEVAPVVVDTGGLSLGEVGEDLLDAADKQVEQILELDLSAFDLAEPGADMGQLKTQAPPPPPDTSNIRLQD